MHTVPETILQHLGGNRFVVMTGAKNFVGSEDALSFKLPRGAKRGINTVRVSLRNDLYVITCYNLRGVNLSRRGEAEDVPVENLRDAFERLTGLYTSL